MTIKDVQDLMNNPQRWRPRVPLDDVIDAAAQWDTTDGLAGTVTVCGPAEDSRPSACWPKPVDLLALAQAEPQPPKFIIEDWLPEGYATLLSGHGGAGKSGIALPLAICMALGRPWMGIDVAQRRVLYLSFEDRKSVIHWRLARVAAYLGVDIADMIDQLHILDLVQHDAVLWTPACLRTGQPTPAAQALRESIAATGAEVLIVDGISDSFGGNEIARAEVRAYISSLLAMVPPHGAVLLIGHVNKATSSGMGGDGYSGSTAWHNSVRARWYLHPERQQDEAPGGDLILELQKSNLGRADQQIRVSWDNDAHLFTGRAITPPTELDRQARDRRERNGILAALRSVVASGDYCPAATTGNRTALHVLRQRSGWPSTIGATATDRRRFWGHVEALRQMGEVREGSIRRANRHQAAVLLPAEACSTRECADASNE